MKNITFCWNNLFDGGVLTYSSRHSNFLETNLQHRWATKSWRSKYGAGSGWGNFVITASVNDRLDFEDNGTTTRVASLTPGTYNADELAVHLKARMEAETADTFTIEYLEATNKFKITDDDGNYELLWNTGANKARSIAGTIGYSDAADDTGDDNYTADNLRIHSEEWVVCDMGSAVGVQAVCLKHFNFSSTSVVKIQANASDAWGSPSVNVTLSLVSDLKTHYFSSVQTYRYWRIFITDIDNSDGYSELGRVFMGTYFTPEKNIQRSYKKNYADPSTTIFSDEGQISTNKKTKFVQYSFRFASMGAADLAILTSMWDVLGHTGAFFFTLDRDNNDTTSFYVRFSRSIVVNHILLETIYSVDVYLEELR